MLSILKEFAEYDINSEERIRNFEEYQVHNINPYKMLIDHCSPREINYL